MLQYEDNNEIKKIVIKEKDISYYTSKNLSEFVRKRTLIFFNKLNISTDFLKEDPSKWNFNEKYNDAKKMDRCIKVVNDVSERAVQLITEYNNVLTKNETEKQYILHVVKEYKKIYY